MLVLVAVTAVGCGRVKGDGGGVTPDAGPDGGPPGAAAPTLELLAGTIGGNGNADGAGAQARFGAPAGAVRDSAGNLYVADLKNHTIRKLSPAGVVTTIAGDPGVAGNSDGAGTTARFNAPVSVALDAAGNLYVADRDNALIRKISPAGTVTTLAGAGVAGNVDGTGASARFNRPEGVAVDAAGNVYVADTSNHTIRKISPAGAVITFAGAGVTGSTDATGTAARFNSPEGIAVDSAGTVYVAEYGNNTIRKITSAGVVTTLAGTAGTFGSADGTGPAAQFIGPNSIALDGAGTLYVTDSANDTIRVVTQAGVVTTLAGAAGAYGSADGGAAARFTQPTGVAIDDVGNLYVSDLGNGTIRKVTSAGSVSTLAGVAEVTGSADGTGGAATFNGPTGIAVDGAGDIYVADSSNETIRKLTAAGVVTTFAGTAGHPGTTDGVGGAVQFVDPIGVAVDAAGNVYVADGSSHTIRKLTAAASSITLVGTASTSGSVDATGAAARFTAPNGLAIDGAGNLYVADTGNDQIRKVTSAGAVTTLAGAAKVAGSTDGGTAARFNGPLGTAVDGAGNVYIADSTNDTIRKLTPDGNVTTLAGAAGVAGTADGDGAAARFSHPTGIAVDGQGNLYVADRGNATIRKITPTGATTTIAGTAGVIGIALGTSPRFSAPMYLAVAGDALVISDGNAVLALRHVVPQ